MACERRDLEPDPARYLDVLRRAFDKHYGEASDVWTTDAQMRGFPETIQARLGLPPATRVLDVGCGAGIDVEYFAGLYAEAVGIDLYPHPDWADVARRRPNARFVCSDLLGHAADTRYDLVFDNGCFHHQHPAHYRAYLQRVATLLGGAGHYVLSTFKNPALNQHVDPNGRLHRFFADDELDAELGAAGLTAFDALEVWQPRRQELYRLTFCRAGR